MAVMVRWAENMATVVPRNGKCESPGCGALMPPIVDRRQYFWWRSKILASISPLKCYAAPMPTPAVTSRRDNVNRTACRRRGLIELTFISLGRARRADTVSKDTNAEQRQPLADVTLRSRYCFLLGG